MTSAAQTRVARALALDAVAAEVTGALESAGVDAILLKGPATVRWLYADDPGRRRYGDVDVLVSPAAFERANAVLAGLGFRHRLAGGRRSELERAYEWVWDRGPREMVELHRSFNGVADHAAFWHAMWQGRSPLHVAGREVQGPGEACAALLYALHAAQHGRDREGSAKPMADLGRALARFDEAVWREAAAIAERVGASGPFAVGLALDPDGARLAERVGLRAAGSSWLQIRAETRVRRGSSKLGALADARTARERLQVAIDGVFPSPAQLRATRPLARRGRLGLAAAYLDRWGAVAAFVPRTAWQWIRSKRPRRPPTPQP